MVIFCVYNKDMIISFHMSSIFFIKHKKYRSFFIFRELLITFCAKKDIHL